MFAGQGVPPFVRHWFYMYSGGCREDVMVKKNSPWTEIKSMRDEMDKIMDETMNLKTRPGQGANRLSLWQPLADIYETGTELVIEVELPGVVQEDINLEVHGTQLSVNGEKKLEREASRSAYQMLERSYGPFSRVFVLPGNIETAPITAVFKNGVLRMRIPKVSRSKTKVNIEVAES
jgi:HSP20 family protein